MARRPWIVAGACLLLAGCAIGRGGAPVGLNLTITRDFGAASLTENSAPLVSAGDTAIRLLERNARVTTGGGTVGVASIDGLAGGGPTDWLYYVNGIAPVHGAKAPALHDGDHVWWDRHGPLTSVPAVVGAFPEPFLHGSLGKRLPVRIECIDPTSKVCDVVTHQLTSRGIPAGRGGLGLAEHDQSLRVLVGAWPKLRTDPAARRLETGPAASGVYARIAPDGRSLILLDAAGAAVRTLGVGSGLVAATRFGDAPPVWIVTGTDATGVAAAAQAFEAGALHDRFALAVSHDIGVPLPTAAG